MKTRGFTIIELLVVVSIVGLISSIVLGNLNQARQRAVTASAQQFEASVRSAIGDRLVGSWNFNEGSGATAFDGSGNNLNGTITGAAYAVPGVDGTDSAMYFSGSNSYVHGTGAPIGDNIPVTISAWIDPMDNTNARTIFMTGNGACTNYRVGINSSWLSVSNNNMTIGIDPNGNQMSQAPQNPDSQFAAVAYAQTGGELAQANPQPITNNRWTSVITSFEPTGVVTTYIDGKLAGTVTGLPATNCGGTGNWSIGAIAVGAGVTEPFIGRIDNVAVYGGTITASEAQRIYAVGVEKLKLAGKM